MISSKGISRNPPSDPSLDFKQLREEGIKLIQALSGGIWTDYNLHDPGVTTLEVLCYALTDLGYRTQLLKEAFGAEGQVAPDFVDHYFFRPDELIPPLPLTKWDFEHFIEENHPKVLSAWFEEYPIFHTNGIIRGGYEIALLLEPDERFGNLNTDVIQVPLEESDAILEVVFFDEENRRLPWKNIKKVMSCHWNEEDPDSFFVFENYNCQVALILEVVFQQHRKSENIHIKARGTLNAAKKSKRLAKTINAYREAIIQTFESTTFTNALTRMLSKEYYKADLLKDIKRTLLPCRNLCEDFVSLRVVNEQEIKIEAEVVLDPYAPMADTMINMLFDRLDAFLFQLMLQAKRPEHHLEKNILYTSNLIEMMVKIEGVEAARIITLNLFIDGVPTIPLKDEASFECIQLQQFSHYVPRIGREKSDISFIRSGTKEKAKVATISKAFDHHFFTRDRLAETTNDEGAEAHLLDQSFFENLQEYYSIQNDFPQNYRLREGELTDKAPKAWQVSVRQFKTYLLFFERILINYLDQLYNFHDLLSVKQKFETSENELERLKAKLPDLDRLQLIDEQKWADNATSAQGYNNHLNRKHKILDHLLARFATSYTPIITEVSDADALEKTLITKMILLKDIPIITRERGLGLSIKSQEIKIWNSDVLSGFQKRMYRLLGVNNEDLRHLQLTRIRSSEPVGFYLVEHILLIRQEEDNIFSKKFNRAAELLYDYITNLSDEYQQYEPYSFQLTIVFPDWYSSWRKRRNTVENRVREELPAHLLPHLHWLNKKEMGEFEILYEDWLKALLQLYKS